jgi:hypothetical protein
VSPRTLDLLVRNVFFFHQWKKPGRGKDPRIRNFFCPDLVGHSRKNVYRLK